MQLTFLWGIIAALAACPLMASPQLGVYRWDAPDGPAKVDAFGEWLGKPAALAQAFEPGDSWQSIRGGEWQLRPWAQWVKARPGRGLLLSVPMLPARPDVSLAKCASGEYDGHWRSLADNLAAHGLLSAYLRPGWEMDGDWFPWSAPAGSGKEAGFAGCFRKVVQVMRAAQPASEWKFVWNPNSGFPSAAYLEATWPGDAYVDVVGIDLYDQSWAPNTYPYPASCDASCRLARQQNAWRDYSRPLFAIRDFARARGKPMAIPEWGITTRPDGHGGGENTHYVRSMHQFINDPSNGVLFHAYFDVTAEDGDHQLSPGEGKPTRFPESAALFRQLFGASRASSK